MANVQLPGQIEPINDERRLTGPLWYQWFFFLQSAITRLLGAWNSTFTPVMTADVGGPPIGTVTCRYRQTGKTIDIAYNISISNINGASGVLFVTLPISPATRGAMLNGRESAIESKTISGGILPGGSTVAIVAYDTSSIVANGAQIILNGTYEV